MEKTELRTPISEQDVRRLKVGDVIYLTGTLITARDAAHKRIQKLLNKGKPLPFDFKDLALFHSGPLVKKINDNWIVFAAGPTTSMRMEPFEDEIIRKLGIRLIVGKGGMGQKTQKAMSETGAVYGVLTGGTAVLVAKQIRKVRNVEWLDLGLPEALWMLEVETFGPLIVALDSYGNNLLERVKTEAEKNKKRIIRDFAF